MNADDIATFELTARDSDGKPLAVYEFHVSKVPDPEIPDGLDPINDRISVDLQPVHDERDAMPRVMVQADPLFDLTIKARLARGQIAEGSQASVVDPLTRARNAYNAGTPGHPIDAAVNAALLEVFGDRVKPHSSGDDVPVAEIVS